MQFHAVAAQLLAAALFAVEEDHDVFDRQSGGAQGRGGSVSAAAAVEEDAAGATARRRWR